MVLPIMRPTRWASIIIWSTYCPWRDTWLGLSYERKRNHKWVHQSHPPWQAPRRTHLLTSVHNNYVNQCLGLSAVDTSIQTQVLRKSQHATSHAVPCMTSHTQEGDSLDNLLNLVWRAGNSTHPNPIHFTPICKKQHNCSKHCALSPW